jgi:prepilin-type N-terminal cleavage/methylation domain-containing protein
VRRQISGSRGFSLVELVVATAVLVAISGATLFIVNTFTQVYTSTALKAEMHSGVRSATGLLAQEIGQAGLFSFTPTTLTAATTATGSVAATVASTSGMYVGQILQVDAGAARESVTITAVGSATKFTGSFANLHGSGAIVYAAGVYPYGILSSSSATSLQMFGDINADGTLMYVQYDCDTTLNFTFSRSATVITAFGPITPALLNPDVVLVDNLVANPGGTPCFQYVTTSVTTSGGATYILYTTVGLTISTQTSQQDPQTQQFITETKSFLNLNPRNILAAVSLAGNNMTAYLQPTPAGLPLP